MSVIPQLFGIKYPIIQGGMIWASGWRLASAVSNCGGLGLLGAGSMYPDVFQEHVQKCKRATGKPFGVNIPLIYPDMDKIIDIVLKEGVKIVFTSAGDPNKWTKTLKAEGITVVHVVSSSKFAAKAEDAGVDAIVAEGFEAGGHNGREETTTLVLVPLVRRRVKLPLIAAGGIATGSAMFAAMALGADGVQIGSRFLASEEASSHASFKQKVVQATEGDTMLTLKQIAPVRLMKNAFYDQVKSLTDSGGNANDLSLLLGRGRAKKGMFEGELETGELEIGQVCALINEVKPVEAIVKDLVDEYHFTKNRLSKVDL